jgi:hypothetical protein
MHTIHRIYIGARNTDHHKFLPNDENRVNGILKKYVKGWTITKSEGYWGTQSEETWIITVVQSPQNQTGYGSGLTSAVGEIASFLGQYAIMWESNGTAVIVQTKKATPVPSVAAPALPAVTIKRKTKVKAKVTP